MYPYAKNGRSSWDPLTALYSVEGKSMFFDETVGDVTLTEKGQTYFTKNSNGKFTLITLNNTAFGSEENCKIAVAEYINACTQKFIDENI